MPQFVEELFTVIRKTHGDYFQYIQWPTSCHYFFEDGTFCHFPADTEQLVQQTVEEVWASERETFAKHLKRSSLYLQ
jgi:hypothetical protein